VVALSVGFGCRSGGVVARLGVVCVVREGRVCLHLVEELRPDNYRSLGVIRYLSLERVFLLSSRSHMLHAYGEYTDEWSERMASFKFDSRHGGGTCEQVDMRFFRSTHKSHFLIQIETHFRRFAVGCGAWQAGLRDCHER
jgi:hypothetical protein